MRNIITISAFLGLVILGVGAYKNANLISNTTSLLSPAPEQSVSIIEPKVKEISQPVSISIPKINIEAAVEEVGLDKNYAMDIPADENNAAWYKLGVKPGELGNSVIAGHFDKKNGKPAIFYKLGELEKGDELIVKDSSGKKLTFKVTYSQSYNLDEFPLKAVFGMHTKPRLNLITCEGVYDKQSKLYSHRLVVYSELVN